MVSAGKLPVPPPCPIIFKQSTKKEKKVIIMVDLSTKTIKEIFNKQVREMTKKSLSSQSFDYQFSDRWIGSYA